MNITAILRAVLTGDYLGYAATGVEEDSPIVTAALALHSILS